MSLWLFVIRQLVSVFNSLAGGRVAAIVGVIILTVVFISTYFLIFKHSTSVLFHAYIWHVITVFCLSKLLPLLSAYQLYDDLDPLMFSLSTACMDSIISLVTEHMPYQGLNPWPYVEPRFSFCTHGCMFAIIMMSYYRACTDNHFITKIGTNI